MQPSHPRLYVPPRVQALTDAVPTPSSARYDFDNLDTVPEDALVVFCVATYGEGEPTDNAVALMDFLKEDPQFTNGSRLDNLHYVMFGRKSSLP